jgi:hypothetical protein
MRPVLFHVPCVLLPRNEAGRGIAFPHRLSATADPPTKAIAYTVPVERASLAARARESRSATKPAPIRPQTHLRASGALDRLLRASTRLFSRPSRTSRAGRESPSPFFHPRRFRPWSPTSFVTSQISFCGVLVVPRDTGGRVKTSGIFRYISVFIPSPFPIVTRAPFPPSLLTTFRVSFLTTIRNTPLGDKMDDNTAGIASGRVFFSLADVRTGPDDRNEWRNRETLPSQSL